MEQIRKAERQTASLRLLAVIAAVVTLTGAVAWLPLVLGALMVAGYNGALLQVTGSAKEYARWGGRLGAWARWLDIAFISIAVAASRDSVSTLHLLYVIDIIAAGYMATRLQIIGATAIASIGGYVVSGVYAHIHSPLILVLVQMAGPIAILSSAALAAIYLRMFKQRDDVMQRRDRKLSTLLEFGTRFSSGDDAARVMEQTLRAAIRDTDATSGYIMLAAPGTSELSTEVAVSVAEERPFPDKLKFGEGIDGYVAQTGKLLVLSREQELKGKKGALPKAGRSGREEGASIKFDGEAVLCIPMVEGGRGAGGAIVGVFTLQSHRSGSRFVDEDVDLARTLAELATMAVVNSRLYEDLRGSFVRSLQSLAKTLEAKDPYTQGHSYRVSELCVMMGRKLRVAPEILDDLKNGALLHDVGKIGVPDAVLSKPARLTDEEFEIMKQHTVIGYEICKQLGLGDAILMLIRNHHEKLDGSGYPDGLKLGELPLPLRIICVADAFDAMSSSRPYRKLMDAGTRNEQLNRFAGTQFDPVVVETLKSLLNGGGLEELYREQWANRPVIDLPPPDLRRAA